MLTQSNKSSYLQNAQKAVFTVFFVLILLQGLFNDLPFLRKGTYIDELLVLILSVFFIKQIFLFDTERDKKDFSIIIVLCVWLVGTYLIAVFNHSKGYLLTLSIYIKSLVLLTGLIYVIKKQFYFKGIIEYLFLINALYGIAQPLIYFLTNIVLPGGGKKLLFYNGVHYLRAGGFCGHPNIFGMMLSL